MIGIYKITSPTGRVYIGQSTNIEKRFLTYKNMYKTCQHRLYNSFNKHGVETHIFEIIEECSIDKLNERERYWQDYYDATGKNGLNCLLTNTSDKKLVHSEYTKMKISKCNKGKLSGSKNPMYGKTHSDEAKYKIMMTHKGRKLTNEHIERIKKNCNPHNKGIPMTDEMKKRISKTKKGVPMDDFVKIKIRETLSKKTVFNTENGIFYLSCNEAAKCYNINKNTLYNYLSGKRPNKTNLIYV